MTQSVKTATQMQQQEFIPPYPATIADTGLKEGFLEELILKDLYLVNFALGREIAAEFTFHLRLSKKYLNT